MPWKHNLNPYVLGPFDLFRLKGIGIRWYGVAYLLGFAMAYFALRKAALTRKVHGLDRATLENLVFGIVIGVLVGGRLGFVVQHLDQVKADPLFPFKLNQGGMAFFGGLVGVILCFLYFRARNKLNLWELGDVLAPIAAIALGIGRIANFLNGELWGKPTGTDWGVIYPLHPDVARHPSELYECASHLLLGVILVLVSRTAWGRRLGVVSGLFLVLYGLMRCVTEIWRDQEYYQWGLSGGQIASFIMALVGVALLLVPKRVPVDTDEENAEISIETETKVPE